MKSTEDSKGGDKSGFAVARTEHESEGDSKMDVPFT
jgi:hypothetical protein